jgi:hypothetical protein
LKESPHVELPKSVILAVLFNIMFIIGKIFFRFLKPTYKKNRQNPCEDADGRTFPFSIFRTTEKPTYGAVQGFISVSA